MELPHFRDDVKGRLSDTRFILCIYLNLFLSMAYAISDYSL